MRLLIITRLYTGVVDSIRTKSWQPKGMPAYYKLLEALDKKDNIEVDAVCLGKEPYRGIGRQNEFRFPNLKINFYITPFKPIRPLKVFGHKIGRRINEIASDIAQFFYCFNSVRKKNYDLIYIDRANIVCGAIISTFLKKKVVVRFFGVGSLIKRMNGMRKYFKEPLAYLSFRAPFEYIICTKEGSGYRYFLERYTNRKTPHEILLNGIDRNTSQNKRSDFIRLKYNIPPQRKIILFLTRLSLDKKPGLFIEALNRLNKLNQNFFAVIVGDGPLRIELEDKVNRYSLNDSVKFENAVEHSLVYDYFSSADIYVSLNSLGNLCNTVLEAINAGKCVVTFKKDTFDHTDEDTEKILRGRAMFINKRRIIEELPVALNELLNDEEKIKSLSFAAKRLAEDLLQNWEERINYEVELLQKIANRK